jgi:hypothetical protein
MSGENRKAGHVRNTATSTQDHVAYDVIIGDIISRRHFDTHQ